MRALILATGLLAAPTLPADQFDLVCRSEGKIIRYRVDLARNEACSDTCDRVWKMGEATSGELKLIDQAPAYRGDLEERATVNRATGEYRYFNDLPTIGRPVTRQGKCEAADFTGFPAAKF